MFIEWCIVILILVHLCREFNNAIDETLKVTENDLEQAIKLAQGVRLILIVLVETTF